MPHLDRALFPHLRWTVYANHAAIGPLPAPVRAAVVEAADALAREGAGAIPALVAAQDRARAAAGALLGRAADEVALVGNTSDGVLAVAWGHPLKPGEGIAIVQGDFPTTTEPYRLAAAARGVPLHEMAADAFMDADPGRALEEVEAALRSGARLVALSAVGFASGVRKPVEALADLCHAHGAALAVDAIQAVGAVDLDLSTADYIAFGGHKWLMSPPGTGALAAPRHRWAGLAPTAASWLSLEQPLDFLFGPPSALDTPRAVRAGPGLVEGGMRNGPGIAGFAEGLRLAAAVGPATTFARANAWHDAAEAALHAQGFHSLRPPPGRRSALLPLRPPPDVTAAALVEALARRGVSAACPLGVLRLSPSWPNHPDEVSHLQDAVAEALRALRSGRP